MLHVITRLMRVSLILSISLIFPLLQGYAHHVQAARNPLFLQLGDDFGGDIFSYTPTVGLKNLTVYGYNGVPILSPDGKTIAYSSYAQTYVQEQFGGNFRSGPPSINIWVMDAASGNAKRIASQPTDNRAPGEARIRPFITRSDPRWSPDGQYLAWMEQAEGTNDRETDQNEHLMLYKLSSDQTKEIYKQDPGGIGSAPPVEWNALGISIITVKAATKPVVLRILNPTGKVQSEIELGTEPVQAQWLDGESSPTLITTNNLITLTDNGHAITLPPLEIYSLSAPDGLCLVSDAGYFNSEWSLVVAGKSPLAIGKLNSYAISPEGTMAAYIPADGLSLSVFDGKKISKVGLGGIKVNHVSQLQASGLAWSALGIRLQTGQ
jgi:dipeptidyl aminopeptidase/acylaminoacyl peptidase